MILYADFSHSSAFFFFFKQSTTAMTTLAQLLISCIQEKEREIPLLHL